MVQKIFFSKCLPLVMLLSSIVGTTNVLASNPFDGKGQSFPSQPSSGSTAESSICYMYNVAEDAFVCIDGSGNLTLTTSHQYAGATPVKLVRSYKSGWLTGYDYKGIVFTANNKYLKLATTGTSLIAYSKPIGANIDPQGDESGFSFRTGSSSRGWYYLSGDGDVISMKKTSSVGESEKWMFIAEKEYEKYLPKTFHFRAKAVASVGEGSVFTAWEKLEEIDPTMYGNTSEKVTTAEGLGEDKEKKIDVFFYAQAGENYKFAGWAEKENAGLTDVIDGSQGQNPYKVTITSSSTSSVDEPQVVYYALFKDKTIKDDPVIMLDGLEAKEVSIKIDATQKVDFAFVDEVALTAIPTIKVVDRIDPGTEPIVVWDAMTKTLTGNRAGTATVTFAHPSTDDFNSQTFTFTIHVEKLDPVVTWRATSLLVGQEYQWTDIIETNSDGAWNLVSSNPTTFASLSQASDVSATANVGTTILTFSQGVSYKYNAVPAQSKDVKVYTETGLAQFTVNGKTYKTLADAIVASTAGGKKYNIVVTEDGVVLPGDYIIPAGVTLVVPYENTGTKCITAPTPQAYHTNATPAKLTIEAFRTLKLTKGVNITVLGAISVAAEITSTDAGHNPSGFPLGPVGCLDMSEGGNIVVENGAKLYAWGFVKGQGYLDGNNTQNVGKITAKDGSIVYEDFSAGDWGGGSYTYAACMNDKSYRIFPFQSYFVQNIEVPVRFEFGSKEVLQLYVYGNEENNPASVDFIGKGNGVMFKINSSDGAVTKWYDPTVDRLVVELEGDSKLDELMIHITFKKYGIPVLDMDVQSGEFDLPIMSNMHIKLKKCDLILSTPMLLQPGSVFEVPENSSITLRTKLFVYDKEQWGTYVQAKYFKPTPLTLSPHISRGDGSNKTLLDDAKLIVNGTLEVTEEGALYTTSDGADIMSDGGGTVVWSRETPKTSEGGNVVYGYTNGNSVDGQSSSPSTLRLKSTYIQDNECQAGWLHNDNDSYTAPAANTSFVNIHGRWFSESASQTLDANHMYTHTYIDGDNSAATSPCFYSADKTGLTAGYKWINFKEVDAAHTGGDTKTFVGMDDNLYTYKDGEWLQLVQMGTSTTYSGSDDNLYNFIGGEWVSLGEIGEDCMYTVNGKKVAVVGDALVELEADEYDAVFVNKANHSDYYMLFDGCVWQHATKVPNTYKAYIVQDNYYVWIDETWTKVEKDGEFFYTTDEQNQKHYYEFNGATFAWVPVSYKVRIEGDGDMQGEYIKWEDAMLYIGQFTNPVVTVLDDISGVSASSTIVPSSKTTSVVIDLHGHTITGTVAQMISFNGKGKALTITDNSDAKNGAIRTTYQADATSGAGYAINIIAGTLNWNAGSLYAHNTWAGESAYSSARSGGVYVTGTAGNVFNLTGGTIEAYSDKNYAYGVYGLANSLINMTGGTIKTHAGTTTSYGVLDYGTMTMSGGEVEAIADYTTSYGIYLNAENAVLTMTGGHVAVEAKGNNLATATDANAFAIVVNKATATATISGATIDAKVSNYTYGQAARAISIIAGATVTLNSGTTLNAEAYKNAYGIVQSSSAATQNTSILNINPGVTINAKARTYVYGIHGYGNMNVKGVTINAETCELAGLPGTTYAYGIYARASANATATNSYHGVLDATNCDIHIKAATTNGYGYAVEGAGSNSTTAVDGTFSNKASADATIDGGTITIEAGNAGENSNVYGIWSRACIDENGNPTKKTVIKNVTMDLHGTHRYVYGIYAAADAADYTGARTYGNVEVENVDVTVTSDYPTDAYAVGAYVQAAAIWLNRGKYRKDVIAAGSGNAKTWYIPADPNDNDVTHEAINGTTSNTNIYRIGEYAVAAKMLIKSGTFRANTTIGTHAFAVQTSRAWSSNRSEKAYADLQIDGGTFIANSAGTNAMGIYNFGNTVVKGGTFTANTTTTTAYGAYCVSGLLTLNGGTFNANATTTTAYGLAASATIDGNYCYVDEGKIIVNDGVVVNAKSLGTTTAYGLYVSGTTKDYTLTTYNSRSAANKEYYYFADLDGNVLVNATKANAFRITQATLSASGMIEVNGGIFNVNTKTSDAYGIDVVSERTVSGVTTYPKAEIKGGFFYVTSGTANRAYAAKLDALKANCLIHGGHYNVSTNLTSTTADKNYVNGNYHVLNCTEDQYKSKYPYEVAEAYAVTFKDGENELWSGLLPAGKLAQYPKNGGVAERESTLEASYEFRGWEPVLDVVTEEATYNARFSEVTKRYMVTWYDDQNVEIDHKEWASGETPTHANPYKEGYDFVEWTPAIQPITGSAQEYKAVFRIKQYTITWNDENGEQIAQETINYGTLPARTAPSRDGYTFYRWEPALEKATADATYQAVYKQNVASVTTTGGVTTTYTSWKDALTAANKLTGATIKLLADVGPLGIQNIETTMTLDLNGHTISGYAGLTSTNSGIYALLQVNKAAITLTITDGSAEQTGTIKTIVNSAFKLAAIYSNLGNIVLEKGNIYAENLYTTINTNYRALGIFTEGTAGVEIKSGVIEAICSAGYSYGVFIKGTGASVVRNCIVRSRAQKYVRGIYTQVNAIIENVQIEVASTYAVADATANVGAYGIYCDATGGAKLNVNNVTINAQAAKLDAYGINLYSNNSGTLSDLKIKATTAPIDTDAPATLKITSGFFDKETNLAKYIGTKKLVPLTTEPEMAEGYNYKIVDAAYQITFCAEDGTELQRSNVEKDVRPVFLDEEPTKPATPKATYVFAGWSDGVMTYASGEIPVASATAVYTAVFEETTIEYPITFYNIDGKGGTHVQMVAYGDTPDYDGPAVVMSGNVGDVAYLHLGWSPELAPVVGATTYTATFRLQQAYQLTYVVNRVEEKTAQVAEGAKIEERKMEKDGFRFDGWYKNSDCSAPWDFQKDEMPEQAMTLYGRWIVVLDVNGVLTDEADFYNAKAGKNLFAVASTKESYDALSDKTNVIFGNKVSSLLLTDKENFTLPAGIDNVTATDLTYTRTLYYGYNTVTLPFDFSVADLNNAGAYGCQILLVNGYTEGVLELVDVHDGVVAAGTPCLVWLPSSTATYTITKSFAKVSSAAPAVQGNDEAKMYGTYVKDTEHVGPGFFGIGKSGEALAKVPGTAYITPFRGSINIPSAASASAAPRIAIVSAPQLPTDVEQTSVRDDARKVLLDNRVYILRGKKMFTIDGTLVR